MPEPAMLHSLWSLPTLELAPRLLGALLVRALPEGWLVGRVVETEAYLHDDPACHGVRELPDGSREHRRTKRNATMFGPPGRAYVYFTYGNHYMLNVVGGPAGVPEAVLIRAVAPLEGVELMTRRRGKVDTRHLTNGPGKLTQAFAITDALDGHDLSCPPLHLVPGDPLPPARIVTTTRIGISKAVACPWRFYERDNPWVSRR